MTPQSILGQRDAAYACFLVVSVASVCVTLATLNENLIVVALWLVLPALPAMLIGIVLSILQWRDGLLPLLSALTIAFIIEVATEAGTTDFYNATTAMYGVVVLVIVASWFLLRRRRVALQPTNAELDASKPHRSDS